MNPDEGERERGGEGACVHAHTRERATWAVASKRLRSRVQGLGFSERATWAVASRRPCRP